MKPNKKSIIKLKNKKHISGKHLFPLVGIDALEDVFHKCFYAKLWKLMLASSMAGWYTGILPRDWLFTPTENV